MRPAFVEVDLNNLKHNLLQIRKHCQNRPIMAIVKANAYGHGLVKIAQLYEKLGVNCLGVALLEEGICLRKSGVTIPIAVFGGVLAHQIQEFLEWELEFFVTSEEILRLVEGTCKSLSKRAEVHIKIDSGMGRIGTHSSESACFIKKVLNTENILIKGVCSHLACSEDPKNPFTLKQLERFLKAVSVFESLGATIPVRHLANSGGVLYFPETHLDMIRPGILLYGVYPDASSPRVLDIKPALQLKSKVTFQKSIKPGMSVSYGATWTSIRESEISTIPLGYADGYPRHLSNRGKVLIKGKLRSIVGRICMDQLMVNCENESTKIGEDVTLIGGQNGKIIRVEELSTLAETIPYEILTNLNTRLPRIYVNG